MSIQQLVDRGIVLRAEIKEREIELKKIEKKLSEHGLKSEHQELKDSDREGRRYLARGSKLEVPIIFTADNLVKSFKHDTDMHRQILSAADGHLHDFYSLTQTYEINFDTGKKFRTTADSILGKAAPAFITACLARDKHGIPKSSIKITWDDAEEIPHQ